MYISTIQGTRPCPTWGKEGKIIIDSKVPTGTGYGLVPWRVIFLGGKVQAVNFMVLR